MNSHLLQGMAVERARDMRNEATAASLARAARPARRAGVVVRSGSSRLARRAVHP